MSNRESMAAADTAWLRMDRATNPMMICGVLMLGDRLGLEELTALLEERFLCFRRFRRRAVERWDGWYWEDDPDFHIRRHVHRIALPGRADKAELERLVGELLSTPLDRSLPLWQFHLVEAYDGGSAVVVRIHHAYADGIALVHVLLSLTRHEGESAQPLPGPERHEHDHDDVLHRLFDPVVDVAEEVYDVGRDVLGWASSLVRRPTRVLGYARNAVALGTEGMRLALLPGDGPHRFKGEVSIEKRVAWAPPLALGDVRTVAKVLGCSINDVLIACVAGALGDYLAARGDDPSRVELRALVPVNLRGHDDWQRLGNRFGMVFLELPLGIGHPVSRLFEVRKRMESLKGSVEPVFAMGLLQVVGRSPQVVQEQVVSMLSEKASAVLTNVPGPQDRLYLGSAPLDEVLFWVPQAGGIGLGVSILSYNGRVQFGLAADAAILPDPGQVIDGFGRQFEKLLKTTLMEVPWSGQPEEHGPIADE